MKNPKIPTSLRSTPWYTMLPIRTILKSQKLFHKQIIPYSMRITQLLFISFHYTKYAWQILKWHKKFHLFIMYNLLLIPQNLEFFLHYHTLLEVSSFQINSIFSSLILQTLSILHFAIYYSNMRHVMQLI